MSFFDTTGIYFEGAGGESIGQYGHSKDHRPDLKQLVLGLLLSGDGRPVSSEIWPGNFADAAALLPVVERLRSRFGLRQVCVVADRGMISADTIKSLEADRRRGGRAIQASVGSGELLSADQIARGHAPRVAQMGRNHQRAHLRQLSGSVAALRTDAAP